MKALKVSLVLGMVFAVGVIVGAVGVRVAVQKVIEQATRRPEVLRNRIEREFVRDLKLTPEQRPKVHAIFVRSHEEIQGLRKDFQPQLAAILKRSEREIRDVLNETQQEKFDRLLKKKPLVPSQNIGAIPKH